MGGLTTKLVALVDRSGRLVKFSLKPGNAAESGELSTLLCDVSTGEVIADKAYDSDSIRDLLSERQITTTIPPKSNRKVQYEYDRESYRTRHRVENFFADLKQFRGIATRYCKLAGSYEAFVNLAGWYWITRDSKLDKQLPL